MQLYLVIKKFTLISMALLIHQFKLLQEKFKKKKDKKSLWKSNSVITKRSEVPAKPSQKLSHHVSFLNGSLASLYPKEASKNVFGINHQPSGLFSNPNMGPKEVQCDQGRLNSPSPYSFARNIDLFQMKVENFDDTTTLCCFFLSTLF